jgi:hypothetical protein
MLGNLQDEALSARYDFHFQSVENLGEFLIELNIHNGSNDLGYLSSTPESSGAAIGTSASELGDTTGGEHGRRRSTESR